jgi:FHA domain
MQEDPSPLPLLPEFKTAARDMTREEFLLAYPRPVFVIEPFLAPDETGFQTITGTKAQATEKKVAVIAKRPEANTFSYMITIGRAGNNDLVIRYQGVSKFHAFIPVETGADTPTRVVDAGSTNGTFVRGERLAPRDDPNPLYDGDEFRLADLCMIFLRAPAFYDFLQTEQV